MHPVAGEGFSGRGFRLRDLVFVVREHQVFAAGVEVEGLAEELHRHGGALDVPAGAAVAESGVPRVLAGFGGLPHGEVRGGVLLVLIDIDARACGIAGQVLLREFAVFGVTLDAEVPGAILGAIGKATLLEFWISATISGMFSVARGIMAGSRRERAQVFEKGPLVRGV